MITLFLTIAIGVGIAWYIFFKYIPELNASHKSSTLSMSAYQKLAQRDSLGDYIPLHLYDEDTKIFHHKNGNFAILYKINPRQFAGTNTATCLEELFNKMHQNMILQICLIGSKNDDGLIDKWRDLHMQRVVEDHSLSEESRNLITNAVNSMAKFFYSKFESSVGKTMTTKAKNFSLYLSISSADLNDLMDFKEGLKNILEGNQFYPHSVTPREAQLIGYEMLNANHSLVPEETRGYDDTQSIGGQCIAPDTVIDFTDEYVKADDRYWIALSPLSFPEYGHISDMGTKIGDYISESLNANQFQDNFVISFSALKNGKRKTDSIKRNHSIILTQKWPESLCRKFNDVKKESISILDRIDVKKEACFSIDLNVLISGPTLKEAEKNADTVTSYWNKGGRTSSIILAKPKGIQQLCFLASIPSCANEEYFDTTKKYFSMFGENAAQFVPIESDWKGTQTPNIMLFSRRGQLAGFDMFESNNNFNGYVIAESGSGKSVFLGMLAFNSYVRGNRIFILDFGGSYKKLCEIMSGQYIEPDREHPFSLNPFSRIQSEEQLSEELDFLSTFIYSLGANKNKEEYEKDEKFLKSFIQDEIKDVYSQLGAKMEVTDVRDNLRSYIRQAQGENAVKLETFVQQLGMYSRGGIYEAFFTGPCEVNFDNEFIVAELQSVEKDADLRDPIAMLLVYHQSSAIYGSKNQGQKKIVNIYDEAHKYIGKDPRMDDFIEQNYRRGRKQGASTIIATQGFEDIYDSGSGQLSRAGKAIINSSSWKFFLKQSETSINLLMKSGVFNLDELEQTFMRRTRTVKGDYSEIFVITPEEAKYVYRLVLDRYFYYIVTTDPADKAKIAEKTSKGMFIGDAINEILAEEEAAKAKENKRSYLPEKQQENSETEKSA